MLAATAVGLRQLGRSDPVDRSVARPSAPAPEPHARPSATVAEASLRVEYAGCMAVVRDTGEFFFDTPRCLYETLDDAEQAAEPEQTCRTHQLRLWVTHPRAEDAEFVVQVDDHDLPLSSVQTYQVKHEPGLGFCISLPEHARSLRVDIPDQPPWSLALRHVTDAPELQAQRAAFRMRSSDIQYRLRGAEIDDDIGPLLSEIEQIIDDGLSTGLLSEVVVLATSASYFVNRLEHPTEAQDLLAGLEPLVSHYPEGQAMLSVYMARPLRRQGQRFASAIASREGSRIARRIAQPTLEFDGLSDYSLMLAELGYVEAAAKWSGVALALGRKHTPREVPRLLDIIATSNLRLMGAGRPYDDPSPYYRELLAPGASETPRREAMAHLGLAEYALLSHDPKATLDHLRRIDAHLLPPRSTVFMGALELSARAELGATPSQLEPILTRLEAIARSHPLEPSINWHVFVRRGQLLEARGDRAGALAAYEEAEEALDQFLLLGALGVGGEGMFARYDEGTQRLISLRLRGPEPQVHDALCVARRAQARLSRLSVVMQRLDGPELENIRPKIHDYREFKREYEQRLRRAKTLPGDEHDRAREEAEIEQRRLQDEALKILATRSHGQIRPPCDELRARTSGELLLGLYPLGDRLLVIAAGDGEPEVQWLSISTVDETDPAALSKLLLDPFDSILEGARHVRVLASGEGAAALPIHALPWRGEPLGLTRPVVYGVELPSPPATTPEAPAPAPTRPHAVVLHDERALGAEDAGKHARDALVELGLEVRSFTTDRPSTLVLRKHLEGASHFFYGGHAYLGPVDDDPDESWPPYPGGADRRPPYLPLDDLAHLEVADILMLHPGPTLAVLLGCDTGVTRSSGQQSLAVAFLGAGSQAVIASTKPVEARQAFILGEGLYRVLGPDIVGDPGAWMMHAMSWARTQGFDEESIGDFRVYVP